MTKSLRRNGGWMRLNARWALPWTLFIALLLCGAGRTMATGYYGPDEYLSRWKSLTETPEFYWSLELKRLASAYHPQEKLVRTWPKQANNGEDPDLWERPKASIDEADKADFEAAIKDGEIKPPDAQKAIEDHMNERTNLDGQHPAGAQDATDDSTTKPAASGTAPATSGTDSTDLSDSNFEGLDSEFSDYSRGAEAYFDKDWDAAGKAWTKLLARPAAERKYRTVWAAFMLGKLALKSGKPDAAVDWFEKTRQLAAQGFADSLGLAADSYGWEGRAFLKQGHPEKAAPMYLNQLALGDLSAVVSLKALIPDRVAVDGLLNYGSDAPAPQSDADKVPEDPKVMAQLQAVAADPLLRRLETAHILATESASYEGADTKPDRGERWLKVLQSAKLTKVEDAEYLGWLAYNTGRYAEAQHWLAMSTGDTPAAEWLRARLQLRAGKTADAAASMAKAWAGLATDVAYTGWDQKVDDNDAYLFVTPAEDEGLAMTEWAGGDMATLHLMRGDFLQALDVFLKGGLWEDAAYVAERVLTTAELNSYVDKMPPVVSGTDTDTRDDTASMRYLLGRRLVREDRYPEAMQYLPPAYAKLLAKYTAALKMGANTAASKQDRAAGWSTAAWIARNDGMELMGTEVAPDGFDSTGNFPNSDIATARLTGVAPKSEDDPTSGEKLPFPATKPEAARIRQDPIHPDIRFHYRIIAAALAIRAAELLPDNSEELADALNTAGNWVKDRDEKLADQYYNLIERRSPNTKIGKEVLAKHWFVDDTGPWSTALTSAEDARHKELGIQDQN